MFTINDFNCHYYMYIPRNKDSEGVSQGTRSSLLGMTDTNCITPESGTSDKPLKFILSNIA